MTAADVIKVNDDTMPWREGLTVQDVLNEKNYTFKMLSVWINDSPVDRERFASTKVPSGANVQVIHMISGG